MGFFKKIGKAIKKNVSFKNLVKVTKTAAGFIPGVGEIVQKGIEMGQGMYDAKKMAKEAEAQGKLEEAAYWNTQTQLLNQTAGNAVGAIVKPVAQVFGSAVMKGVNDGLGNGVVEGGGQIGATFLTSTLKVWFQKNWKILAGVVAGLIALIWFVRRNKTGARKRR